MSQELRTTESNARSSIYLKTERLPSFLVGSCSCVEQKVCWRSDLGWLCLGVQRNLFWVLCFRIVGNGSRELALTLQKPPRVPGTIVVQAFWR